MKVEFIIKTAKKRGYKTTKGMTSNCVYVQKGAWGKIFNSYNEFYKQILKGN